MLPATRGSPCRRILLFGTCIALISPPAAARVEPASLPNWGAEAAAAKPAKPAEPAPAPAPAAAPEPEADVELVDDPPASRTPRKARRAGNGGGGKARSKARPSKGMKASLERAAAERKPIQDHAKGLENAGRLEEAAKSMTVGAEAWDDPVLHLAAADLWIKLGQTRGRAGVADDDRGINHLRTAETLLKTAPAESPRVDPEEHATLQAWSSELEAAARRHKSAMGVKKNGHGQIIAGSLLGVTGLAGLGIMSGGLYLNSVSDRELAKGAGRPEDELAPLRDQKKQGETMIAAGAITGAIGLAIGIALVSLGARDLKASRAEQLQARVRVAPTLGGLVLVGRF
jgi:hypothetical protein